MGTTTIDLSWLPTGVIIAIAVAVFGAIGTCVFVMVAIRAGKGNVKGAISTFLVLAICAVGMGFLANNVLIKIGNGAATSYNNSTGTGTAPAPAHRPAP